MLRLLRLLLLQKFVNIIEHISGRPNKRLAITTCCLREDVGGAVGFEA